MSSTMPNAQLVREELEKVLASPGFARNERLSGFLRFVVERQLEGQAGTLKETVIAVEAFGRRPDYDPKLDSIVRTEAARLRTRLAEYYAGEGLGDAVVIDLPKGGYVPEVHVRENQPPDQSVPLVDPAAEPMSFRTWRSRWTMLVLGGVLVIALGLIWWLNRDAGTTGAADLAPTIAVLPFMNRSTEPDSDYFVDGLTDQIIRNLSIIDGLEVRSRTSSFVFKDNQHKLSEVAEKLNVNYVLEGASQRSGGNLRVTAQFIRVADDKPLWTGKFDKQTKDIFDIQDEISRQIVNALRVNLGRGRRRYDTSVEAYDLYLRALTAPSLGARLGPFMEKLVTLYQDVIDKDPSFAPAYAEMAFIHALQSTLFAYDYPDDAVAKLRVAAEKAIQLDPLLEDAHVAIAILRARDGQWEQSEKSFREAIRLNPNRADTFCQYADLLLEAVGRLPDAIGQLRHAQKADPLSGYAKEKLAKVMISIGQHEEAAVHIEQLRDDPHAGDWSIMAARLRLGQGRTTEAIQLLESDPKRSFGPLLRGWLGNAYVRAGRRAEAEKLAAASKFPNEQALIFAGLGDKDRTFAALKSMGSRGPQPVGKFLTYPEFAFLRGDPRLAVLRKNVGLPPVISSE